MACGRNTPFSLIFHFLTNAGCWGTLTQFRETEIEGSSRVVGHTNGSVRYTLRIKFAHRRRRFELEMEGDSSFGRAVEEVESLFGFCLVRLQ